MPDPSISVDDICRDFGLTRSQLVGILSRDDGAMSLVTQQFRPIFFNSLDKESERLSLPGSPFASPSNPNAPLNSTGFSNSPQSESVRQQKLAIIEDSEPGEVVQDLLSSVRRDAPVLHSVIKAVTRYDTSKRVGSVIGGIGTMLRCRKTDCDGLPRMLGLFGLCNLVSREYFHLLSAFGYAISYNDAHELYRKLEWRGKSSQFARPALRKLERSLFNYETSSSESSSPTQMEVDPDSKLLTELTAQKPNVSLPQLGDKPDPTDTVPKSTESGTVSSLAPRDTENFPALTFPARDPIDSTHARLTFGRELRAMPPQDHRNPRPTLPPQHHFNHPPTFPTPHATMFYNEIRPLQNYDGWHGGHERLFGVAAQVENGYRSERYYGSRLEYWEYAVKEERLDRDEGWH